MGWEEEGRDLWRGGCNNEGGERRGEEEEEEERCWGTLRGHHLLH